MNINTITPFVVIFLLSCSAIARTMDILNENKTINIQSNNIVIENLNAVQEAFNTSSSTANIKVCKQSKVTICKLRLRERIATLLKFDEKIKSFILGDSLNFSFEQINNSRHTFKLQGIYPGADTNLTAIGESGLIYAFYIRIDSVKSKFLPFFVVRVVANPLLLKKTKENKKALQVENEIEKNSSKEINIDEVKKSIDYLSTKPSVKPESLNFNFKIINGDEALMPKTIFDDGVWTYWQYGDKNLNSTSKLPVIYAVVDGHDMPVNSKIEGGYLITETISDKWTIRSGEAHACVHKFK